MNWFEKLPIFSQIFFASAIGNAFISFIFRLGEMIIRYRLEHSRDNFEYKRKLAEDVIAICVEGSSTSFTVKPRDIEAIYVVIEKIKSLDNKIGESMGLFVSNWQICASRHFGRTRLSDDEIKFVIKLQEDGRDQSRKILNNVQRWKK